jgi:hypothetical protein
VHRLASLFDLRLAMVLPLALAALGTPALAQDRPDAEVIAEALKQPFTASFADTRLALVVAQVQDRGKINVVLAPGVNADLPVTLSSSGQPLAEVLTQLERTRSLAHTVWCGALVIHPAATPPGPEPTLPSGGLFDERLNMAFDAAPFLLALERVRARTSLGLEVTNRARAAVGAAGQGVTLKLQRIQLKHLLVHLARAAGLTLAFEPTKVTFDAARAAGEVDARTIDFDRNTAMTTDPDADLPKLLRELKVPATREASKRGLLRAPKTAAPQVAQALTDADPATAIALLQVLASLGSQAETNAVLAVFKDERRSLEVRTEAGIALGKMKAAGAIPALIDALDDPWFRIAETARAALVQIGEPVVEPLQARWQPAAGAVGHDGLVYRGLLVFGSIGSERCKQLLLAALGTTQGARAVPLRHHAAIGLGFTNDPKVIEPMIDALEREKQQLVCTYIARSLTWITNQELGVSAPTWRSWWAANKRRLLQPKDDLYDPVTVPTGPDGLPIIPTEPQKPDAPKPPAGGQH